MDWIERLLHLAPDGGNGTFEMSILLAVVALTVVVAYVVLAHRAGRIEW